MLILLCFFIKTPLLILIVLSIHFILQKRWAERLNWQKATWTRAQQVTQNTQGEKLPWLYRRKWRDGGKTNWVMVLVSSVLCRMKTFNHSEQQLPVEAPVTTTPITSSVSPVNWWNAKQPTWAKMTQKHHETGELCGNNFWTQSSPCCLCLVVLKNLDPHMKKLLMEAKLTKEDLKDKDVAEAVDCIIKHFGGLKAVQRELRNRGTSS